MITFTATDAKNRFGELLEMVNREPVEIDKKGRPVAVVVSYTSYQEMLEGLGEAAAPSDLGWLRKWRESVAHTATGGPLDEVDYHRHLDHKYGK